MLARELELHGAPNVLARVARRSMHDEIRHARIMSSLAGAPIEVTVAIGQPRSLEEMALDNAQEGCVREAFGALEAAWQSVHAKDPVVRAANMEIARDEARHALLSLAIDDWSAPRIGRAKLRAAREEAAHRFQHELRTRTLVDGAGMIPAEPALALLDAFA
jgi:hypothetical protein